MDLSDRDKVRVFNAVEALRGLSPRLREVALGMAGGISKPVVRAKGNGRARATRAKVEAWVKGRVRGFAPRQMAAGLGCTETAARQWCLVMVDAKLIRRVSKGKYVPVLKKK